MKHVGTIALLISLAITGYLLWDTQQQLASTEDDALHFMELAGRASTLTLAMTRYSYGGCKNARITLEHSQNYRDCKIADLPQAICEAMVAHAEGKS